MSIFDRFDGSFGSVIKSVKCEGQVVLIETVACGNLELQPIQGLYFSSYTWRYSWGKIFVVSCKTPAYGISCSVGLTLKDEDDKILSFSELDIHPGKNASFSHRYRMEDRTLVLQNIENNGWGITDITALDVHRTSIEQSSVPEHIRTFLTY